jgi:large subunit ribosomal protein L15
MKLHDLRPADGSRQPRTRVGRGIAAGKGKTAGRGTKGQKARAGGSIPPWFEGGQTPLHMRIPKLRGFKNRFKVEYEVVNVGAIGALAEGGAFEVEGGQKPSRSAPITVNQDILRAVGLVRTLNKPMKILGAGDLSVPLFVVADAFTASARAKIEAAGGSVNVLEIPSSPIAALGVTREPEATEAEAPTTTSAAAKAPTAKAPAESTSEKPAKGAVAKGAAARSATAKAPSAKASKSADAKAEAKRASATTEEMAPAADESETAPDDVAAAEDAPAAESPDAAGVEPAAAGAEADTPSGDDA